jgi:hypothetical protein
MSTRRLTLAGLALSLTAGCLALASAPALALKTRLELPFAGFTALPFGSLDKPAGITIDQVTGNIYVEDSSGSSETLPSDDLKVWGPEGGAPVGGGPQELSGAGTPKGQFGFRGERTSPAIDNACYYQGIGGEACALADPSNGDIYVPVVRNEPGYPVVDKFRLNAAHEYEYLCQFTGYTNGGGVECLKNIPTQEAEQEVEFTAPRSAAVDRQGDLYIGEQRLGTIYEYNPAGEPVRSIASPLASEPQSIALDASGDIYVASGFPGVLVELKRSSFTGAVESEVEVAAACHTVTVDQATGHLFCTSGGEAAEYDQSGTLEARFALPETFGLAVNEALNYLFTSSIYGGIGRVDAFGLPIVLPVVTTEGASNIQVERATVAGSVNPEGLDATTRFEYGTSSSLGSSVVGSPSLVSGESAVPVTAELMGLEPHLTYYYRLAVTNSESSFHGATQTFATPAVKPVVASTSVSRVGPREALLSADIDAKNSATTYHFLFGASESYGLSIPAASGSAGASFGPRPVANSVVGLQPGVTYHFAVVATNSQGTVQSSDRTFTTLTPLLPLVQSGAAGEVAPNGVTLSGSVDPRGLPTSYEFDIGTDTTYGSRIFGQAGAGTEAETATLSVTGLAAGTLYHYRLVASNTYGTAYGADETFTTPAFPTALIASPLGAPLVPTPAFTAPSIAGAVTIDTTKAKRKAKVRKHKRRKRGTGKAHRAARFHGSGRNGR